MEVMKEMKLLMQSLELIIKREENLVIDFFYKRNLILEYIICMQPE